MLAAAQALLTAGLPYDVWREYLLPYVSLGDLQSLAASCRALRQLIKDQGAAQLQVRRTVAAAVAAADTQSWQGG